jgi:hypothetical protein
MSAVHLSPMADTNYENSEQAVFDAGDDSIIADPVLPELPEALASQRLARRARIG